MDKITDVEYNLNQNIKEIIGNTLMEQTMNITIVTIITVISIIVINIYLLLNIITEKIIKKINTDIIDKKVLEVTEKINHRLLVIENDMKNSIITKLDKISAVQQIQDTNVKQVLDGLLVEQANNKIFSALKDEIIHEFSENTNRRLVTIENKLEILGTNRNKDMNELFDKIKLCIINNMNKNQETDINNDKEKNMIKSIEDIINTRLTDMKKDIQNSFIQHMKETTEKINKRTGLFTKNTNISVMKEQSTDASLNKTQPQQLNDQWNDLISSICSLTIPSSVLVRSSIWKEKKTPEEDELDKYMVSKTGCGYVACVRGDDALYRLPDTKLLGARLQWRGAVRGGEDAFIRFEWRSNAHGYDTGGYSIYIGEKLNTVTRVVDSRTYYSLQELHTPRLLSRDRYVWFHLTLEPGRFTFRTTCDEKLVFTHAADIKKGETVRMSFDSNSTYGTKFLYDCLMDVE